ncbi:MAG: hypothetical protein K2X82_23210, partial [Gemmataceae bacterium]|nr:hypothetical protein [Gemmataceae bacterium]
MRYVWALLAVSAAGAAGAQVTMATSGLQVPDYYDKLAEVVNAQIAGHRVVSEHKDWDVLRPGDPDPVVVSRRVAVHGKDRWVSRESALPPPAGDGKDRFVHVLSPDDFYVMRFKPPGDKYTVLGHGTEWEKPDNYANTVRLFSASVQLYQPQNVSALLEVADDRYEGRKSRRITLRTRDGVTRTVHVDRKTYQHLYSEADRVMDYKARGLVPGTAARRTEYREDGGRLWPTREEIYHVRADGTRQPVAEETILEYHPYTPAADELDLEAQFGVKPIPHDPRPDSAKPNPLRSAGGSGAWLYAAAGVLSAAAVA